MDKKKFVQMGLGLLPFLIATEPELFAEEGEIVKKEPTKKERLDMSKNEFVLRQKESPFNFIGRQENHFVITKNISEAICLERQRAKEVLKEYPDFKMVKIKHLPIRTLLKREKQNG